MKNNQNIMGQILYKKVVDLLLDYAVTNEVEFDEHGHYHSEEQENELYDTYSPEENAGNNDQVKEEENKEE